MTRPLSTRQADRLGLALCDGTAGPEDEELLQVLLGYAQEVLDRVVPLIEDVCRDFPADIEQPVSRPKTRTTLIEKLQRNSGRGLGTVYDLAGVRVVGGLRLYEQDALAELIGAVVPGTKPPRKIDRRANPSSGYRALHVVYPDGFPVEIQVRTRLQHAWADTNEAMADLVGRQIRYGEPPDTGLGLGLDLGIPEDMALMSRLSDSIHDVETTLSGPPDELDSAEVAEAEQALENSVAELARVRDNLTRLRAPQGRAAAVKHFVLVYHRKGGRLESITSYGTGAEAMRRRFDMERTHRDPDIEVVVLNARSVDQLRKTHGRYFQRDEADHPAAV